MNEKPIYLGTMSGTSMDGLDLAAVSFDDKLPSLLHQRNIAYPQALRQKLQSIAHNPRATINEMCLADTQLGLFYSEQINQFLSDYQIDSDKVAAIGSHGQTIRHCPQGTLPYTLQIGDPNIIAAQTGITVVADFRRRDLAHGGQGAPLAPAFHQQVFRSNSSNRVIANIGGIANITCLPADSSLPVTGFDSGPGNTLLDHLSLQFLDREYDPGGEFARSGTIDHSIVKDMLKNEPYFQQKSPKSTGTDYFSPSWLSRFPLHKLSPADRMATLLELTAVSLAQAIQSLPIDVGQCFVCGGGAHNHYLIERLGHHLKPIQLESSAKLGIHPDWVEAMAFAWLARQTMMRLAGNLPSVTNAQKFTILGGVYY